MRILHYITYIVCLLRVSATPVAILGEDAPFFSFICPSKCQIGTLNSVMVGSLHVKVKFSLCLPRSHFCKWRCCLCVLKRSIHMKVRDQLNVTAALFLRKRPLEPTEQKAGQAQEWVQTLQGQHKFLAAARNQTTTPQDVQAHSLVIILTIPFISCSFQFLFHSDPNI